ncbi:MAG: hypothetical protein U0414_30445 [Polyangiaceae bacterium]
MHRFVVLFIVLAGCDGAPPRTPEGPLPTSSATAAASASGTTTGGGAKNPSCGTTEPAAWSVCSQADLVCEFGAGHSCRCTESRCITPAGPIPDCKPTLGWVCRDDGCPWDMSAACTQPGKTCMQDDGMCAFDYVCKDGHWKQAGGPGCRP